jgi:hypothetical protein
MFANASRVGNKPTIGKRTDRFRAHYRLRRRSTALDCFYYLFRLTLGLFRIVGAEEIQGRSSGVAVIRPVNLLQTSTSIQRKNKPSARWEATSEFDPELPVTNVCYAEVQRPVWAAVLEKHLGDTTYGEALGTSVP